MPYSFNIFVGYGFPFNLRTLVAVSSQRSYRTFIPDDILQGMTRCKALGGLSATPDPKSLQKKWVDRLEVSRLNCAQVVPRRGVALELDIALQKVLQYLSA